MHPPHLALALLLSCGACGAVQPPYASLPSDAVIGAGDPTRAAILGTSYAFAAPSRMAGQPGQAARAVAQVEYLAAEIPVGPRWVGFNPAIGKQLTDARDELRLALDIDPAAPPQAVVDGLYGASRALAAGGGAAGLLPPPVFGAGDATLTRLASLPDLPRTRSATAMAQQELTRLDQDGRFNSGGGSDRP